MMKFKKYLSFAPTRQYLELESFTFIFDRINVYKKNRRDIHKKI